MSAVNFVDINSPNVYGIYGLLGGGKTLTAVEIALYFLSKGFPVASNIQLYNLREDWSRHFSYIDNILTCDYKKLPCGSPRGSGGNIRSAIIIDEVAEWFDQNSFASPLTKNFSSWLRHSSKRGQFVFLIVQHPDFIAKALRKLCTRWIACCDLAQFRFPILGFHIPFMGGFVSRQVFDRQGNRLSHGLNLCLKSEIGQYYDTAQSLMSGDEAIKKQRRYDFFPFLFILSVFYLFLIYYYQ